MTTRSPRISKTTKTLIEDLKQIEADDYLSADFKRGFRHAVLFAVMSDTLLPSRDADAYLTKQLAA